MSTISRCAASAAVLMALAGSVLAQQGGTPIAMSGRATGDALSSGSANGTNGLAFSGTAFSASGRTSVLNQNGDVVFIGAYAGGIGAWRHMASGSNQNLARGNTALPAPASSGTYSPTLAWSSPFVDSAGNAAFYNAIAGTTGPLGSTTDAGMFRASTSGSVNFGTRGSNTGGLSGTGTGRALPVDYSATPATEAQASTNGTMANMNSSGAMMYNGSWNNGTTNGSGLWLGSATSGNYDTLTPVFISGVDTFSGVGYSGITGSFVTTVSFNDSGRYAGSMDFINSPTSAQNRGIATNRNGANELLLMRSTAAPWLPSGVTVGAIGQMSPSMNNAGQVAASFAVAGTGIVANNDSMVARFNADGSVDTLQEGAGSDRNIGGANVRLGALGTTVAISAQGRVFGISTANYDSNGVSLPTNAGNSALYRWSPETGVNVIVLTGDTAPSTGGGQFASFNSIGRAVNGNDQIAFLTNLVTTAGNPGGVTSSNDLCLYATDVSGNLILIAREGFALPGDVVAGRTVTSILFGSSVNSLPTNGQDGRGIFFNDAGQIVFNVGFSDGNSAVFVANVAPTPGVAALLGLGALAVGRRRRV